MWINALITIGMLIISNIFMIWALKAASIGYKFKLASVACYNFLMGNCACRVFISGSSQPHWLRWKRRSVHSDAAKDTSGGDYACNIHGVHSGVLSR